MNSAFDQCSLYLIPGQHDYKTKEFSHFIHKLWDIGFISQKIDTQSTDNRYLTGSRFLDHIAYMGCSPAIQFAPNKDDENFCHVNIHQYDSARLIVSKKQSRAPHCPSCKKPVKNWNENKTSTSILCDQCHTHSSIGEFNWRKMAGYALLFIEITDIFPKEATPQQILLDKLADITGVEWVYFYSCR